MLDASSLDRVVPAGWRDAPVRPGDAVAGGPGAGTAAGGGAAVAPPCLQHVALDPAAIAARAPRPAEHLSIAVAAGIALVAHVGLLVALERVPSGPVGAGGIDIEAVSVEVSLLPASALESRARAPTAAAGVASDVATTDGVSEPAATSPPAAATAPPPPTPAEAAQAPAIIEAKPEPIDPEALALPAAERKPETPKPEAPVPTETATGKAEAPVATPTERPERTEEPAKHVAAAAAPAPAAAAEAPAGGTAARAATAELVPTAGAAAASKGEIAAYARSVASALQRTAPRGVPGTGRGTVMIEFVVAIDGGLDDVRVMQSSGRPRLDELAVAAVRAARFPAAPAGLGPKDRTYRMPYHFR